jgi:hypothetical protein
MGQARRDESAANRGGRRGRLDHRHGLKIAVLLGLLYWRIQESRRPRIVTIGYGSRGAGPAGRQHAQQQWVV